MDQKSDIKELERNIDSLEHFIEQYTKLEKKTERPKNIFSILRGPKEEKYQSALRYFLNPAQPHGFKDTILKAFLEKIEEKTGDHFGTYSSRVKNDHVELETEVNIKGKDDRYGRIDLIIAGGPSSQKHPEWAIFVELKVGASEGEEQTERYAYARSWNFNWFENDTLNISELDEHQYVYIKKEMESEAKSDKFESISWANLVQTFEDKIEKGMFDYPHRSVIQFLDFLRSLKEVENMEDEAKKRDLEQVSERLKLYFEQKDLIEKVEEANRQFQQDFEELADHLHETWEDKLKKIYDFTYSDWSTRQANQKFREYDKVYPNYWSQKDRNLEVFFTHSTTTNSLREGELKFRVRLPPQRREHKKTNNYGKSFNDLFEGELYDNRERLKDVLNDPDSTDLSFGTAGAVLSKKYELIEKNLYNSYLKNLEKACEEFCENEELIEIINECFESAYEEAFSEEPEGEKPKILKRK